MTRFLCAKKRQTRSSIRQEGQCNSRKIAPGSNMPAVSRLKHKEGRILQADPRFQAVSRLSRPDKEEDSRQNSRCTATSSEDKTKPVVHSDQANKGG
jgi:hypothetical protein